MLIPVDTAARIPAIGVGTYLTANSHFFAFVHIYKGKGR